MRISTNEFMLGSLNDMLAQQSNINTLNREVSTGQTLLDASDDPGGASEALTASSTIARYSYDLNNAQAATNSLQTGVAALQQVTNVIEQLRQTAVQAANVSSSPSARQSLAQSAQGALQELIQLANTQGPNGNYVFSGTLAKTVPYSAQPNGTVVFNGDAGKNQIEIAPSLTVASTISGSGVFTDIPAGNGGIAVSAASANTGGAYAVAEGPTDATQVSAARLAGTQYEISFTAGSNGGLNYSVTSGSGSPGSAGFTASSGVVASGAFSANSDLVFGGIDVRVNGTPSAGDSFDVNPNARTSVFQTVQNLVTALQAAPGSVGQSTQVQQQLENVLADLDGMQNSVLTAQAAMGSTLSEIQAVQQQDSSLQTNAQSELSNVQSANLPAVMANYSESVTALQASQLAFAKVQNLSLFDYIQK